MYVLSSSGRRSGNDPATLCEFHLGIRIGVANAPDHGHFTVLSEAVAYYTSSDTVFNRIVVFTNILYDKLPVQ